MAYVRWLQWFTHFSFNFSRTHASVFLPQDRLLLAHRLPNIFSFEQLQKINSIISAPVLFDVMLEILFVFECSKFNIVCLKGVNSQFVFFLICFRNHFCSFLVWWNAFTEHFERSLPFYKGKAVSGSQSTIGAKNKKTHQNHNWPTDLNSITCFNSAMAVWDNPSQTFEGRYMIQHGLTRAPPFLSVQHPFLPPGTK